MDHRQHRTTGRHLLAALALIAMLALAGPAVAGDSKPNVVPPHAQAFGKSYEAWAAAWSTWVLEHPATNHPLLDQTGADCDENQRGKVWFLAGNFGGETERSCTIPNGKGIFFPVFNAWVDNVDPFGPPTRLTEEELAAVCEGFVADPSALAVTIDGRSLRNLEDYMIEPTLFSYTMPGTDSLYDLLAPGNTFAGDVPEPGAVTCGSYVLLKPLSKGHHTLHITAANADASFSLDVTYDLTIAKSR